MPIHRRTGRLGMSEEARQSRRHSIGGSDARIIMSGNQEAIERLWRQKRGEIPQDDLSDALLVQMGVVMEALVLDWFEYKTGYVVKSEQHRCVHKDYAHLSCTLDGMVHQEDSGPELGILEAKFMFPFSFRLDEAVAKYAPQLMHNMAVTGQDRAWLTIVTGAAGFHQVEIEADPFYQACMLDDLNAFWDCVQTGKVPGNPVLPPPPVKAVNVVTMEGNNSWAAEAATMLETFDASERFEVAKKEIKKLMPADAKEASGHGVVLKRATNGRISIVLDEEALAEARERKRLLASVA